MKLSIATDAISADFETAILLGIEWGVDYFELKRVFGKRIPDISADEVAGVERVLRAHEVELSSLAPGLFKIPIDPAAIAAEAGDRFDRTIALADRLGVRSIVIFGFIRDDRHTERDAIARIVDAFGPVAARAQREGLTLFLENDRGLWGEHPRLVREILAGVNSPALRLNWDPGNLVGAFPERPFPGGYELLREFVGHVHVKDAKAGGPNKFTHAMVNEGEVGWADQFEALARDGFNGFCVVEPHYGSRVDSSRQHLIQTRRAMRIARRRLEAGRG